MPTPILMFAGGGDAALIMFATMGLSFAAMTLTFFGLRAWHKKRHPDEEDIKETNRQRREREKLKRETTQKVNDYMKGKKSGKSGEEEHIPNGKRSGRFNKKKKK